MHLKITARFVATVASAAVAPLIIYGVISINSLRSGNEIAVTAGNLNLARQAADRIEQYLTSSITVLQSVAAELRGTELRQWQQDRILKDYVLDFPEFRELTLFAPDGRVLATSRIGPPRLNIPAAVTGPDPYVAPVTVDDDFLPTTTVTIPLSRLGLPDGWLMGELNLEELWRVVDDIRVGTEGFALLVATDGRLVAHGNPNEKARVAAGENLSQHALVSSLSRDNTLSLEYPGPDGRMVLGVAAAIASRDWTVLIEQPTSEAYALANEQVINLLLVITMALVVTVALGYYWGRSFIRPIQSLIVGTRAIAEGRLDDRVEIGGHDELHQLGDAFNRMAHRLSKLQDDVRRQERQAMFGRIAAGLVHDISHPIQNIRNSCRLILKLGDDIEYRGVFQETVDREFSTIKRVLDDLRNLARPMPLERFPVDVNRSIKETVDGMESLAETAGLTLTHRMSGAPLYVEGDLFALGRVYRNLIVNAIEATSPGGEILVRTEDTGDAARIYVSDTGLGISPDRLGAIFDDFNTTKRRGLGLGLAISRKIIEQLGGTIRVTSTVGSGTTFVVELPKTDDRPFPTAVATG